MRSILRFSIFLLCLVSFVTPSFSDFIFDPKTGKFYKVDGQIEKSAQDQFNLAKKFYDEKKYTDAIKAYKNVAKFFPGDPLVSEALMRLASLYEEQGSYFDAYKTYQKILTDFPQSKDFDEIVQKEFELGNKLMDATAKKGAFGLSFSNPQSQAADVFEQVIKNAPYGPYGDKAQFNAAMAYKKIGKFQESQDAFQAILDNYPSSTLRDQASYQLADVSFLVAKYRTQDGVVAKEAREKINTFSQEFPDSQLAQEAEQLRKQLDDDNASKSFEIAQFYEHDGFFESAAIYYDDILQNFPQSVWAKKAQRRLDAIHTPKSYFSQARTRIDSEKDQVTQELAALRAQKEQNMKAGKIKENSIIMERIQTLELQEKGLTKEATQLGKEKKNLVSRLYAGVKRSQGEIKEKEKELAVRSKAYKQAGDEEGDASLAARTEILKLEKKKVTQQEKDLSRVQSELGVSYKPIGLPQLPAIGGIPNGGAVLLAPLAPLSQLFQAEQVRLTQITEQQTKLREQRAQFYENRKAILDEIQELALNQSSLEKNKDGFFEEINSRSEKLKQMQTELQVQKDELEVLRSTLSLKKRSLDSRKGGSGLGGIPQGAASATLEVMSGLNFLAKKETKTNIEKKLDTADNSQVSLEDLTREVTQLERELARREKTVRDTQNALNHEREKLNQKQVVQQYSKQYSSSDNSYFKTRSQLERKLEQESRKIQASLSQEEVLVRQEAQFYAVAQQRALDHMKQAQKKTDSEKVSEFEQKKQEAEDLLEQATNKGAYVRAEKTLEMPSVKEDVAPVVSQPNFALFQPSQAQRVVESKLKPVHSPKIALTQPALQAQRNYLLTQWVDAAGEQRKDLNNQISDVDRKLTALVDRAFNSLKRNEKNVQSELTKLSKSKTKDSEKITELSQEMTEIREQENSLSALKKDIVDHAKLRQSEMKNKPVESNLAATDVSKSAASNQVLEFKKKERLKLEAQYEKLGNSKQQLYDKLARLDQSGTGLDESPVPETSVAGLEAKLTDLQGQVQLHQKQISALQGNFLEQSKKAVDGMIRPIGNMLPQKNIPTEQLISRLHKELDEMTQEAEKKKVLISELRDQVQTAQPERPSEEEIAKWKALELKLQEQIISLKALAVEKHHKLGQTTEPDEKSLLEIESLINSISEREKHLSETEQKIEQANRPTDQKSENKIIQRLKAENKSFEKLMSDIESKQAQIKKISSARSTDASESSRTRDEQLIDQLQEKIHLLNAEIQETKKQLREEKRKTQKAGHATKVIGTSAGLKKTVSKSLLQVLNQEKTIVQEQAKLYQDWLNRLERETNRATKVNSKQETISTIVDQKLRLEQFLHERYPYLMASLSEEENRIRRDK